MKFTYIVGFVMLLFSCSCTNKSNEKDSDNELLVLDFDKTPEMDELLISSFITSVTPIVLQTTDDNLIGFLSDMQVTHDYICVLDAGPGGSGSLFIFDKKGKYLRKIGQRGQGPGEYVSISDFTIDENKDEIYLMDYKSEKIRVYKLSTGDMVRSLSVKDDKVNYRHLQYSGDKVYANITYFNRTEEGPMVYKLNGNNGDIDNKYLDIKIYNHGWSKSFFKGESFFYCKNSQEPKYTHYFMDTIMAIRNGGMEPYLVIKSKDWVTCKDVINNRNTTRDIEEDALFKIRKMPIAFNVQNYVESDGYIYFTYSKQQERIEVVYDKKKEIVFRTKLLLDDVMFNGSAQDRIQLIGCGDDNGMYGYINTVSVPSFYDYIHDPASSIRPEYSKIFDDKITSDSNPIILYYEYKK